MPTPPVLNGLTFSRRSSSAVAAATVATTLEQYGTCVRFTRKDRIRNNNNIVTIMKYQRRGRVKGRRETTIHYSVHCCTATVATTAPGWLAAECKSIDACTYIILFLLLLYIGS